MSVFIATLLFATQSTKPISSSITVIRLFAGGLDFRSNGGHEMRIARKSSSSWIDAARSLLSYQPKDFARRHKYRTSAVHG